MGCHEGPCYAEPHWDGYASWHSLRMISAHIMLVDNITLLLEVIMYVLKCYHVSDIVSGTWMILKEFVVSILDSGPVYTYYWTLNAYPNDTPSPTRPNILIFSKQFTNWGPSIQKYEPFNKLLGEALSVLIWGEYEKIPFTVNLKTRMRRDKDKGTNGIMSEENSTQHRNHDDVAYGESFSAIQPH